MRKASQKLRDAAALRMSLISWYDQDRRDLPWRRTCDPYRIWVSEIMLQQTRVAVVIPRYQRFLRKFPSVQKLASAREMSVLAEWSGLGYYRRARSLHAAAKLVAREGKFPQSAAEWLFLPGIGRYTAAAIASIAFNEPAAVLDGNVERVLRRLIGHPLTRVASWDAAQELLDPMRPGDFNQAMMELGSTLCIPSQPMCGECPISRFCRTHGHGDTPSRKPCVNKRTVAYELVLSDGSVRLVHRSSTARLMPSMWELPSCGGGKKGDRLLFSLKHSITNTDYDVRVIERSQAGSHQGVWIKISRLPQLALTGLARKILCIAGVIS